jgi:DNA-binding LacI/PurR family transcriptional regulator
MLKTEKQKPVTVFDVAKRAGVGKSTVSAVLNGSPAPFAESTRKRIFDAARELRYQPNAVARGLRSQRLNSVGVTFHYADPAWILADYYGTTLLMGIVGGAHARGYSTTLFHKPWRDAERSAAAFRGQGIDGFLVIAPQSHSDMVEGLFSLGIPLVVISHPGDEYGVPSVIVDNAKGVRLAVDHLISLGHERIAHVTDFADLYDCADRTEEFKRTTGEKALSIPPEYVGFVGNRMDFGAGDRAGYLAARRMLTLPRRPTAIVTTGDGVAVSTIEAARDLRIKVPGELSVIGFDDNILARQASPPLTTVRQPLVEMGRAAAQMLITMIGGESVPPIARVFEPELVVRESTGPAPA